MAQKVFVGVSGGVDSSVSLALLQKQGFDVTGVFLRVWHPDFLVCDWREERRDAMRVCATLGVPFMTIDCEAEYKKEVVDYMIREYSLGRVPNPDIFCNKYVKFGVFLKKAKEMGADYIATGHYAQVKKGEGDTDSLFQLHESVDENKDQSYFLYTLGQQELSHALFPVGGLTKPEVRKLAEEFNLPTATKKDSQGLCFLGKIDMKDFLSHYIPQKRGDVLDSSGEVVGHHDGSMFYTIGQRHGFTITKKGTADPRFFVISKDVEKNTITVGAYTDENRDTFAVKELYIKNMHWVGDVPTEFPFAVSARIRYRQEKQVCTITRDGDGYRIAFAKPQIGVPVGQSVVLYSDTECLGGGIIDSAE